MKKSDVFKLSEMSGLSLFCERLVQSHFRILYVNLTVKAPPLQNKASRAQFKNAFAAVFTFGTRMIIKDEPGSFLPFTSDPLSTGHAYVVPFERVHTQTPPGVYDSRISHLIADC